MGNVFRFLGGLLLGAVAGAGVTLLLTPQSGDDLQTNIRQHLNTVIQEGRRAAEERRAELEAQFAQAKQVTKSS